MRWGGVVNAGMEEGGGVGREGGTADDDAWRKLQGNEKVSNG